MSVDVILASATIVVAVLSPIVVWILRRQGSRDLRSSIERDLDTLKGMEPSSRTAELLTWNLHKNMQLMARRERRREVLNGWYVQMAIAVPIGLYLIGASAIYVAVGLPGWLTTALFVVGGGTVGVGIGGGLGFRYKWRDAKAEIEALPFYEVDERHAD